MYHWKNGHSDVRPGHFILIILLSVVVLWNEFYAKICRYVWLTLQPNHKTEFAWICEADKCQSIICIDHIFTLLQMLENRHTYCRPTIMVFLISESHSIRWTVLFSLVTYCKKVCLRRLSTSRKPYMKTSQAKWGIQQPLPIVSFKHWG